MTKLKRAAQAGFGRTLRSSRLQAGLTQEQLAAHSGVHRTYVSDIEAGNRNVSLENIFKLAMALGLVPSALFREFEREVLG